MVDERRGVHVYRTLSRSTRAHRRVKAEPAHGFEAQERRIVAEPGQILGDSAVAEDGGDDGRLDVTVWQGFGLREARHRA